MGETVMAKQPFSAAIALAGLVLAAALPGCAEGLPGPPPSASTGTGGADSGIQIQDGAMTGTGGVMGTGGLDMGTGGTGGTGGMGTGGVGTGGVGTGGMGTGGMGTGGMGTGGGSGKPPCDAAKCPMGLGMGCCKTDGTCGTSLLGLPCA
ncbi:MAG: hypothetical protein ACHQ53_07575 [Polyangiales bacterium]